MTKLIEEVKRRHVFRFAGIYIVSGWVLLQVADVVVPAAGLPEWIITFVLYLAMLGFPFALAFAWMFNLTRKGVEQDKQDASRQPFSPASPVFIVALLIFAGSAYFAYKKALPAPELTPSIAVLPFENLTGDASQDFLSDGITEEIMNSLFRLDNMKVISRTSVFAIKNLNLDLPEIGSRLSVENILEGNLKINGDAIRLAVRMINVATGKRMWAETFDGELSDFEFQDNITNTVTAAISGVFGREPPPVKKAATREVLAREHFLRGIYYYQQREQENMERAIDLFQQAIDVDPLYANAWAALGQAIFFIGPDDYNLGQDERLNAIADKALELDPDNSRALTLKANLAIFADWDFKTALALIQRAIEIAPGDGNTRHFYAIQLGLAGSLETALAEQRIAASLNPLYPPLLVGIAARLRHLWRFEEAEEIYLQSIKNGYERDIGQLFFLYGELGRIEDATAIMLRPGHQTELDNWDRMMLAYYANDHAEAARIYAEHLLPRMPPASEFNPKAMTSAAYAGDLDYAFESLMAAAETRNFLAIRIIRSRKFSDEFYSDPRFLEFWMHANVKPLFDLYLEANKAPWIPIMKAAIAKRETEST